MFCICETARNHLLAELCVLVETELGVHAQHVAALDLCQRVDLDLCRVLFLKQFVQLDKDVCGLVLALGFEFELLCGLECSLLGQAVVKVDWDGDDGRRVLLGDVFDAASRGTKMNQFFASVAKRRPPHFMPPWRDATMAGPPMPRSFKIAT